MTKKNMHKLLLADDDMDDCIFFKEALEELSPDSTLVTVKDGVELMQFLTAPSGDLPDTVFLDLNMPRKTGYECLSEIKLIPGLKHLPVIVFSTSFNPEMLKMLYENGAHYYLRKPGEFSMLKELIQKSLNLVSSHNKKQPPIENFVLFSGCET
jgi:CheY-like chemotaxis protein